MIKVTVNNNVMEVSEDTSLENLIEKTGYLQFELAVAVNNRVITRPKWTDTILQDGDNIIVIKAVSGG